jgi:hypothetical protein
MPDLLFAANSTCTVSLPEPLRRFFFFLLVAAFTGCGRSRAPEAAAHYWEDSVYEFAVAVIQGKDPLNPAPSLKSDALALIGPDHVTDVPARFVADPFLWPAPGGGWHLFFEILNAANGRGEIGLSWSADGRQWTYEGVVLRESFHLSYPLVFERDGRHYMLAETHQDGAVQLYEAEAYPREWRSVARLVEKPYADATIFRHADHWWMFASTTCNRQLSLYHADGPMGEWREHSSSPVVRDDRRTARMGGRVFSRDGRLYRAAQDCAPRYGYQVRLFEILTLTPGAYEEREIESSPVLTAGLTPWAAWGMHHFDPHPLPGTDRWIMATDGYGPAQPETVVDARFGETAHLGGLTMRPAPVRAGHPLMLRFFWVEPPPSGLIMFVHIRNENGIVFQADHEPDGRRVYELSPIVPETVEPGAYAVWVGVYDPETGETRSPRGKYPRHRSRLRLPVELHVR